ncbi:hypothetical protein BS50DRAFT_607327 [Corynespora cassiicola Philippines]|uniref:Mid2 domain-containing protein n=1 Tax=Corynespora cassiicola Philippines TaxID=1448308 RepID=A0A2T2P1X4_CORCC|nr:hypothetical protein BS50DRAFT_607327 [Corynespora cassiicola Philippines]
MGPLYKCLRGVSVAALLHVSLAQQCYYPNGSEAPEKPCSSADGSACCPDKWECLDNGLCHYPPDNLYGRYSCTDQNWEADGCPANLCTYNMSAAGGESITQCSDHDDQWCCNADAQHVDCCKESPEPRPFFALQDGRAYATVGSRTGSSAPNLASITGLATGSGSGIRPSSTPPPSSSDRPQSSDSPSSSADSSSSSSSATPTPVTTLSTTISSGTAGTSTLVITQTRTQLPTDTASPSTTTPPSSSSSSKIPVIVGCAVGIPLSLSLLAILTWLLRKHRSQKNKHLLASPNPYDDPYNNINGPPATTSTAGNTTPLPAAGVAELGGGQGVGPERPVSTIKGRAELDSGAGFVEGHAAHAPHLVGVGGGSARPRTEQAAADGARYVAYRPPPGHAAATVTTTTTMGGLQNVPEMSELSDAPTPPAK